MGIDIGKYGFILKEDNKEHSLYTKQIAENEVELSVSGNTYTLGVWDGDNYIKVANRYLIENQYQLDFLIFKGRVGALFIPLDCPTHTI